MNRLNQWIAALFLAIGLLGFGLSARSEEPAPEPAPEAPPEAAPEKVIVLDAITQATPRYQPMRWTKHDAHANAMKGNCKRCHHDLRGSNTEPGACADCHTAPVADMSLVEAYHEMCRNCHVGRKLKGKKHGPVSCLGCHTERE